MKAPVKVELAKRVPDEKCISKKEKEDQIGPLRDQNIKNLD